MANSSSYILKTKDRCVVAFHGDTAGRTIFDIDENAFDSQNYPFVITEGTDLRASLSRVAYGISGSPILIGFAGKNTGLDANPSLVLAHGHKEIDLERLALSNKLTEVDSIGRFYVKMPANTVASIYMEFIRQIPVLTSNWS